MDFICKQQKVSLSEAQCRRLIEQDIERIKEWKYYNNLAELDKTYSDDEFHCMYMGDCTNFLTELGVNLCVDNDTRYIWKDTPLLLFMENNYYNEPVTEYIPIAVHPYQPFILDETIPLRISEDYVEDVFEFIKEEYYTLVEYANERISHDEFEVHLLRKPLREGIKTDVIFLDKYTFNLPTNLWFDIKEKPLCIKFRNETNPNLWHKISVDKKEPILLEHSEAETPANVIRKVKDFVAVNYDYLMRAANGKYDTLYLFMRDIMPLELKFPCLFNEDVVNIGFDAFHEDMILFHYYDERSREFVNRVSRTYPFRHCGSEGILEAKLNVVKNRTNSAVLFEKIKDILWRIAKKNGLRVNFTHTYGMERCIDKVRERFDERERDLLKRNTVY